MAKDLIPPPSPAGRPEPETSDTASRIADGLWSGGESTRRAELPAADEPPAATAAPRGPSPYRSRFGFVVGALIGVVLAALGLGVILAMNASQERTPDGWSAWRPKSGDDLATAKQIAEHVGAKYRLGDADQLVAVQSSGLEIADRPLSVALRTASVGGDIELLDGHGVMYTLNGLGKHGSIASGKASEERHLLLRREALELSLYTFHYADDVDMVVTLLPPSPDEASAETSGQLPPVQALFYRPGDLRGELGVPLAATIPAKTPRPEQINLAKPEYKRLDALTRSNLFKATFQQGQDASVFLVLER